MVLEKNVSANSRQKYLDGQARGAYHLRKSLDDSFKDRSSPQLEGVCKYCSPSLSKIAEGFTRLTHNGSDLKKRKKCYPNPKDSSRAHYQNAVAQNEWIRGNIFDSMGNYLYCHDCVLKAIHVSRQRLARQRRIKRNKFQQEVTMTKKEIDEKKLGPFVVMPSTIELCFKIWWQDLPDEHEVSVRYPFERHGLAGRISNHAKTDTKRKFLDFVDSNSQPNGRQLDSRNPTHYLSPKFTTITTPKEGVHNYESRLSTSLLGEFNRIQEEIGESTISNYSASTWLKTDRPKIAIYPHKVDYCDKCAMIKSKIQEKQTTINRKLQSGNALLEEIKAIEEEKQVLENELQTHRDVARDSLQYYKEAKEKCAQDWAKICELEMKSNKTHSEEDNFLLQNTVSHYY